MLVGGEEGWFEGARRSIAGYFKWVEVTNEGVLSYRSQNFNKKGTAITDEAVLHQVDEIATTLANKLRIDTSGRR